MTCVHSRSFVSGRSVCMEVPPRADTTIRPNDALLQDAAFLPAPRHRCGDSPISRVPLRERQVRGILAHGRRRWLRLRAFVSPTSTHAEQPHGDEPGGRRLRCRKLRCGAHGKSSRVGTRRRTRRRAEMIGPARSGNDGPPSKKKRRPHAAVGVWVGTRTAKRPTSASTSHRQAARSRASCCMCSSST